MVHNSAGVHDNTVEMNMTLHGLRRSDFTESAAKEFGIIKSDLRKLGRTIPDVDVQIASIARVFDLVVLTDDGHFSYIANLRTENWTR